MRRLILALLIITLVLLVVALYVGMDRLSTDIANAASPYPKPGK